MGQKKRDDRLSPAVTGFVAVLVIVLIVLCGVFVGLINKSVEEQTNGFVEEMTKYSQMTVDERISTKIGILEEKAFMLKGAEEMSDGEIVETLNDLMSDNKFDYIFFINKKGEAYTGFGKGTKKANGLYFNRVLKGETVVYEELPDSEKTVYVYFDIPVRNVNGEIIGVGVGRILKEKFSSELMFNVQNTVCTAYVLDKNGEVILSPENEQSLFSTGDNVFEMDYFSDEERRSIKNNMQLTDSSGITYVDTNTGRYIVGYSHSDLDDRTVLITFPYECVNSTSNLVRTYAAVFAICFIIASIVFIGAVTVSFSISVKKLKEQTEISERLAYVDSVTGFGTWNKFEQTLSTLLVDHSINYAVVSIDIDKFRAVNDMLGHEGGDSILREIAQIINRSLTEDETFARNNSDLFYLLVSYKDKEELLKKIHNIISDVDYQITDFKVLLSIGIYMITDRNMSARKIADRADLARRSVKNKNESAYAFFDNEMLSQVREEKEIENIMEQALETREFKVYYQPKVSLDNKNDIVGAEALVRWIRHGEVIPPGRFIPLFEKNHFVLRLDMYVFEEVCIQQKHWINMGRKPFVISVNMSRVHLQDAGFVNKLAEICRRYNVPPEVFEIEITESAAFENLDVLERVFKELKEFGFHISIDDFGTGYSSLNMLKNLPVDVLKIDREFLSGAEENKRACDIIAHVISLAVALNMKTISEGIETEEQAQLLTKLGCNMAQGFYFAKPVPVEEFEKRAYGGAERT